MAFTLEHLFTSPIDPNTKLASAAPTPPRPQAPSGTSKVASAIDAALLEADRQKTASAQPRTPTQDLEKLAAQAAQSSREATIKEAQDYGRAICDGFMAQLSVYEKVASEQSQASAANAAQEQAAYENTYNQTVQAIHKTAAQHYLLGLEQVDEILG